MKSMLLFGAGAFGWSIMLIVEILVFSLCLLSFLSRSLFFMHFAKYFDKLWNLNFLGQCFIWLGSMTCWGYLMCNVGMNKFFFPTCWLVA